MGCACSKSEDHTRGPKPEDMREKMNQNMRFKWHPSAKKLIKDVLGYPFEMHKYTTQDGYINTVYRIPGPKGSDSTIGLANKSTGRKIVLYQHGLFDCFAGIISKGEDSLGLRLVNEGYELWMNNSRGNNFSQEHQKFELDDCTEAEKLFYYDYSFAEMGQYDQPALWNYIESVTGEKEIAYIGHSQGTTQMFAALSENPEFFRDRMKVFIAIAPVIKLAHAQNPMAQQGHKVVNDLTKAMGLLGPRLMHEPMANDPFSDLILQNSNNLGSWGTAARVTKNLSDSEPDLIDKKALEAYMKFFPSGSSFKCLDHYRQVLVTDEFKKYDYGSVEKNQMHYGQDTPPFYEWDKISGFNIALICGKTDLLASPGDYQQINDTFVLTGLNQLHYHEYPQGHLGLVIPKDNEPVDKMFDLVTYYH